MEKYKSKAVVDWVYKKDGDVEAIINFHIKAEQKKGWLFDQVEIYTDGDKIDQYINIVMIFKKY